jgi:hypothetical protein
VVLLVSTFSLLEAIKTRLLSFLKLEIEKEEIPYIVWTLQQSFGTAAGRNVIAGFFLRLRLHSTKDTTLVRDITFRIESNL